MAKRQSCVRVLWTKVLKSFHLGSVSWNGKVSDDKPGDGVPDVRLQVKAGAVEGIIKRHAEDCVRHH